MKMRLRQFEEMAAYLSFLSTYYIFNLVEVLAREQQRHFLGELHEELAPAIPKRRANSSVQLSVIDNG